MIDEKCVVLLLPCWSLVYYPLYCVDNVLSAFFVLDETSPERLVDLVLLC